MDILIKMTISSSVVLLLIILLKMILKNRISPGWHMLMWIIPAVRMIVPRLPESPASIENLLYNNELINNIAADHAENASPLNISIGTENIIMTIWASGAVILALFFLISAIRSRIKASRLSDCTDSDILDALDECCTKLDLKPKKITVKTGSDTNMLYGIARPVICISDGFAIAELKSVFVHELYHHKSRDILIKAIWIGFICIYWFDPLVWISFRLLCRDMEMYCDYRAVKLLGDRKAYSSVLLKSACRKKTVFSPGTAMVNGSKEISDRIKNIALYRRSGKIISAFMVCILISASVFCLTEGNYKRFESADISSISGAVYADHGFTEEKYGELVMLDLKAIER